MQIPRILPAKRLRMESKALVIDWGVGVPGGVGVVLVRVAPSPPSRTG
jgi:hypothetical protein